MRVMRVLVILAAFTFAGVTNALMVEAGTYTDGAGLGVLVTSIAAMTVILHRLDRRAAARASGGND